MFRKLSIPGRRSSQLKRLSVPQKDIPQEKNGKSGNEAKKSCIPRPAGFSSRSSSSERDAGVASSSVFRSASVELNFERGQKSIGHARSAENLTTPKNACKTPVVGSRLSRATSTSKKSVRKDLRPLSDKAFQNSELAKVHEYLIYEGIVEPQQIHEVRNPMTLKIFVHIMNSLFQKFSPSVCVTVSNYIEVIPNFMKKIKFPGLINRSWLVTANSPHSWPQILGIISWLTRALSTSVAPLEYVCDDENDILEVEDVKELFCYAGKRYVEWTEYDTECDTEEDKQFFFELVKDKRERLTQQLSGLNKEMHHLDSESEINSAEEMASQEKLKESLAVKSRTESEMKNKKKYLEDRMVYIEKGMNEILVLQSNIQSLKMNITTYIESKSNDDSSSDPITDEDIAKIQSEVISLENSVKCQKTHVADIISCLYNVDLVTARLHSLLEKKVLQRDAILRECRFESLDVNNLRIHLNPLDKDYDNNLKKHHDNVNKISNHVKEMTNENKNKEKELTNNINKTTNDIELSQDKMHNLETEEELLQKELEKNKKIICDLESKKSGELIEQTEKDLKLQALLKDANNTLSNLLSESKSLTEKLERDQAKYEYILAQCSQELEKFTEDCTNILMKLM